jgi:hypothetical protein
MSSPSSGYRCEICFALKLINVIDLKLSLGFIFGIISNPIRAVIARSTMITASATPRAFTNCCLLLA